MPAPMADGASIGAHRAHDGDASKDSAQARKTDASAPHGGSTVTLKVDPQDIVQLATVFYECATELEHKLRDARFKLTLSKPLLGDPASQWRYEQHNRYFVTNPNSVLNICLQHQKMYQEMYESLVQAAKQYHFTERLNQSILQARRSMALDGSFS